MPFLGHTCLLREWFPSMVSMLNSWSGFWLFDQQIPKFECVLLPRIFDVLLTLLLFFHDAIAGRFGV